MQLHIRAVELVVELMEAAEGVDRMEPRELSKLLRDTADVLGDLLERDVPPQERSKPSR